MEFLEQIFCQLRDWVEERLQFVFHMSLHIATPLLHNNFQPKLQVSGEASWDADFYFGCAFQYASIGQQNMYEAQVHQCLGKIHRGLVTGAKSDY